MITCVITGWALFSRMIDTKPICVITGCGSGWCLFKGSCYRPITHVTRNYRHADLFCQAGHGYLTEIQTAEENSFVAGLTGKGNVWIGYNDRAQEGTWIWSITGKSGTYTNWSPGEPDNGGNSDCAILWSGQEWTFWDDVRCDHTQWFVCEKGTAVQCSPYETCTVPWKVCCAPSFLSECTPSSICRYLLNYLPNTFVQMGGGGWVLLCLRKISGLIKKQSCHDREHIKRFCVGKPCMLSDYLWSQKLRHLF